MDRRHLLQGIVALTLVGHGPARAAGRKPAAPGLYRATGDVRVNGLPAREGMAVAHGDTITTGPGSEAIYVVGQDAYLQRDRSTVSILGDAAKGLLRVVSGKLLAVFGKGEKRIETATATIGIRGTGCYLESEPARVYFCLCYGTADITPLRAPQRTETITTRHHDHPLVIPAAGDVMLAPAAVANHGDDELVLLESLVGRTPPFVSPSPYSPRY